MIKVEEKEGFFGIIEGGKEVVPFEHATPEGAVGEWEYFETLNVTERQFLPHKRTLEEIEQIKNELLQN